MALSRDQVVSTAVDLLRRYGLGDLSMRRLARELGVAPGALYWHVANKQELLVEVAGRLLAAIPEPDPQRPAEEALAAHAHALREAVRHVPDGADVVALAHAVDPVSLRPVEDLVRLVGRAGVPAREREAVAEVVLHHVLGSVTTEHNQRIALDLDPDFRARDAAAVAKAFEVGLEVVLAGLRRA